MKGRVLIVRSGPRGEREELSPVAVMCWHAHKGNWPLAVLDLGYRTGLDVGRGRGLVENVRLSALAVRGQRIVGTENRPKRA